MIDSAFLPALIPVFLVGLLGSVHCIGMCGGIVGALSTAPRRTIPIAVATTSGAPAMLQASVLPSEAMRVLAYNGGRLASYAVAGALAGGLAQGARAFVSVSSFQVGGFVLANLMLVALGLYLMEAWRGLARVEAVGNLVWRRVQPGLKHFMPMDTPLKAVGLGALWGWVPCGMVYSVLLTAMMSGSAASGAAVMLAFGLGTLPMLFGLGMAGQSLRVLARSRKVRLAAGLIVLGFGIIGLLRITNGISLGWLDALCLTPGAH